MTPAEVGTERLRLPLWTADDVARLRGEGRDPVRGRPPHPEPRAHAKLCCGD